MFFFCDLRVLAKKLASRLATQRKSLREFNLRPLATTCRSVWPRLHCESSRITLYLDCVQPPLPQKNRTGGGVAVQGLRCVKNRLGNRFKTLSGFKNRGHISLIFFLENLLSMIWKFVELRVLQENNS